ncbi:MAG: flagellar hook-basal body complex protein [Alphaproteobacteria bacterium]|nr:flagellar hook-basal body complex protein [Alphaproteobacteria bacterium]MDD9919083.1 flagellar hook-basal body complex protein [Alphaproteobacteria bacterium]
MGLFGAMTASVSGLSAQGESISVISDNLSNTNTIGYKASRALFSQLVTTGGSGGTTYNAGGAQSDITRNQATQGSIISTTSATDLSLSGNGFFVVTDSASITTDTAYFYTRAGAFSEDKSGYLVNPSGLYLQGWQTDSDGNILNLQNPQSVELQSVGVSAQATTEVNVGANLTSTETNNTNYDTTSSLATDLGTIIATPTLADYVTDVRVYDAQGGARDVSIAFSKRGANFWDWSMYTDGSNIEGGTANTNTSIGTGTVRFNLDGTLKYATGTSLTVDWAGGVDDGSMTGYFGDYSGGGVVSATTSLDFTDHVRDIAIEEDISSTDTTAPTGTYTLVLTAANTWQLTDPNGQVDTLTTSGTAEQELLFQFPGAGADREYDVRMTVSNSFAVTAGSYPSTVGDFTVSSVAAYDTGAGSDGVIQYAASYNTSFINQNGFSSGTLSNIQVDEEGFVSGTFTNGETKKLWKLAIGVFQNPAGLETVSGSLLRVTESSGQVLLKEAGVGSTASVVSGSLEGSTVDIANEFSSMIVSQRSYQANSTVISTVDQMLNELLQLR